MEGGEDHDELLAEVEAMCGGHSGCDELLDPWGACPPRGHATCRSAALGCNCISVDARRSPLPTHIVRRAADGRSQSCQSEATRTQQRGRDSLRTATDPAPCFRCRSLGA